MAARRRKARPTSDGPRQASIYLRISLDKTGEGLGVERQEEACRALCERQGWDVREVYCDNDISATSGKRRPAFEALMASDPELIVCWHTDRLVRLSTELSRVIDLGCDVYGVTAGHLDLSNPAGRAVARTITAWAEYEGEQKAERQRAAGRQRASKGRSWWGTRPFGYEMDGTLREPEAKALSEAYAGVIRGLSVAAVARQINAEGHVTTFSKPWGPASLRPVLLNARNAGIRVYDGEEIGPAQWESAVPEETFRAAVRILTNPARGKGGQGPLSSSMLTGIATCGVCGGGVKVNRRYHWKDKTQSYQVYVCKTSSCASVPVEFVEGRVLAEVVERLHEPGFRESWTRPVPGDDDRVAALKEERRLVEQHALDSAVDYSDGRISRQVFLLLQDRSTARVRQIEADLADLGSAFDLGDVLADPEYVFQEFDSMDVADRRRLIAALIERVSLHPRAKGTKRLPSECVQVELRERARA